jgi:hypothetical protein
MKTLQMKRTLLINAVTLGVCAQWASAQPLPLVLTKPSLDGNGVMIVWSGGSGPYLIQRKTGLADAAWTDVMTASNSTSAVIPADSDSGFYRLVDATTNSVRAFSTWMAGAAERPVPLTNSASGFGSFFLEGSTLTYRINYTGLSGSPTSAQIYGPAQTGTNGSVLLSLGPIVPGTAGTLAGQLTLNFLEVAYLKLGQVYANIGTASSSSGELRGQIAPIQYIASLRGTNEVPTVQTGGSGTGQFSLVGNQLWYRVSYTNLSSGATAAQIYGPASITQTANAMQSFVSPAGTFGELTGELILTNPQLDALIDGLMYVNVLTPNNVAGEIRGQITLPGLTSGRGQ